MIETLIVELQCMGLQLNASKTKWFTACDMSESCHVEVGGSFVEISHGATAHKYLCRLLPGTLKTRADTELTHSLQVAWAKFQKHKHILTNRHVSVKLRLKYFDAIISPTVLFGLASLPLTASHFKRIDVVQRRMIRAIVGWVAVDKFDWRDTTRRMNSKVEAALKIFPVCSWLKSAFKRRFRFAAHVAGSNTWPGFATLWDPSENWRDNFYSMPFRARGRPQKRWDDILRQFCEHMYGDDLWFGHARQYAT